MNKPHYLTNRPGFCKLKLPLRRMQVGGSAVGGVLGRGAAEKIEGYPNRRGAALQGRVLTRGKLGIGRSLANVSCHSLEALHHCSVQRIDR